MLLLLLPEQVSPYWEDIKEGIEKTLPPGMPDRTQRMLTAILSGTIQVWISYRNEGGSKVVDGVALTKIENDDEVFGVRDLALFCLWAIEKTHENTWREGLKALIDFGRSRGCNRLTGWSEVPLLIDIIKDAGGEAKYTFLTLSI